MPQSDSKQVSDPSKKDGAASTTVRLTEYTGLEVKTLWNHFSKDSLITSAELGALLERILIKDSTDLLTDLKKSASWKKYATKVLTAMDTSKGETLDLSEFSSEFNKINQRRLYYFLRYLFPDILVHLRNICQQMGLSESEMKELDRILTARNDEQVPVSAAEVIEEDTSDKDEIDRLTALLSILESRVAELEALIQNERDEAIEKEREWNKKISEADINKLKSENEALLAREFEVAKLKWTEEKTELNNEFKNIIDENEQLRKALAGSKKSINDLNNEVLRVLTELNNELNKGGKDVLKFTGTGLTGIDLDPLRTELVRRFGSIDAFIATLGKKGATEKRGITLNELELLGVSMGYSREYCKKLFYTLDTHDRGIVSISQFGRPFPIINKELCLLTKGDLKKQND